MPERKKKQRKRHGTRKVAVERRLLGPQLPSSQHLHHGTIWVVTRILRANQLIDISDISIKIKRQHSSTAVGTSGVCDDTWFNQHTIVASISFPNRSNPSLVATRHNFGSLITLFPFMPLLLLNYLFASQFKRKQTNKCRTRSRRLFPAFASLLSVYLTSSSSSLSFKENHLPAARLRFFLSRKLHGQSYDEHVSFSTVQTRVNWLQSITSLPKRHRLSAITRFRNPHQRTY